MFLIYLIIDYLILYKCQRIIFIVIFLKNSKKAILKSYE